MTFVVILISFRILTGENQKALEVNQISFNAFGLLSEFQPEKTSRLLKSFGLLSNGENRMTFVVIQISFRILTEENQTALEVNQISFNAFGLLKVWAIERDEFCLIDGLVLPLLFAILYFLTYTLKLLCILFGVTGWCGPDRETSLSQGIFIVEITYVLLVN